MPPTEKLISAGLNENGDESFVGRALFSGEDATTELIVCGPRIGLYFPYAGKQIRINSNFDYYEREDDCEYEWVASMNGEKVFRAVRIISPPLTFYVARVYAHNSYHTGKLALENKVIFYGHQGLEESSSNYEVLTCKRIARNENRLERDVR